MVILSRAEALYLFWAVVYATFLSFYVRAISITYLSSNWNFVLVLTGLELVLEFLLVCSPNGSERACKSWCATTVLIFQALIVCYNAAVIYSDGSEVWLWFLTISNGIRFILFLFLAIYSVVCTEENQLPTPQLSQPRPNLLANEPPTTALTNFEDVEQPPPSYEEYLAQGNDFPPKYEDLEEAPPAYQETIL